MPDGTEMYNHIMPENIKSNDREGTQNMDPEGTEMHRVLMMLSRIETRTPVLKCYELFSGEVTNIFGTVQYCSDTGIWFSSEVNVCMRNSSVK